MKFLGIHQLTVGINHYVLCFDIHEFVTAKIVKGQEVMEVRFQLFYCSNT